LPSWKSDRRYGKSDSDRRPEWLRFFALECRNAKREQNMKSAPFLRCLEETRNKRCKRFTVSKTESGLLPLFDRIFFVL